jgi:hypothetical protein
MLRISSEWCIRDYSMTVVASENLFRVNAGTSWEVTECREIVGSQVEIGGDQSTCSKGEVGTLDCDRAIAM